jgi:hypothetical protein
MRKSFVWIIFIICAYFLIGARFMVSMKWLSHVRTQQIELLQSNKYTFGDLYELASLPQFRFLTNLPNFEVPRDSSKQARKLHLYILGDSYLSSFFHEDPAYYSGIKNVKFTPWTKDVQIQTDTLKSGNSVLLIECVERNAISRLKLEEIKSRIHLARPTQNTGITTTDVSQFSNFMDIYNRIKSHIYTTTLESNLEFLLFDRAIFRVFKESKAILNFNLFNRTDDYVSVSSDKSFLYLKETIDPNVIGSSFFPVSEEMLLDFVNHLNEINDYYLKAGFKKVLISIPANPVAILQTEEKPTNQLLTRLRKHPNLKVELVDPSDSLKVNASQNYFKSDSHWNTNGAKIWLTYLNRSLEKI